MRRPPFTFLPRGRAVRPLLAAIVALMLSGPALAQSGGAANQEGAGSTAGGAAGSGAASSDEAATQPLTFAEALAMAPDASTDILSARTALATARRDQQRTLADPNSLRVDRISAQNAVDAAEGTLAGAVASNRVNVASAFFSALEGDTSLRLAELSHDIAQQTLEAQQARQAAGAATDLDVAKAANDEQAARASIVSATTERTLAYATLSSLLGITADELAPLGDMPSLDTVDAYLQRAATENAQVIAAQDAVTLAEARFDASDNDFTARADLEAARQALADARTSVTDTKRTLQLNVASAFARAQAAASTVTNAKANDATAAEDLQTAAARLEAGSISQLTYRSSESTRAQAAQSLENARHAYVNAVLALEQTVIGR